MTGAKVRLILAITAFLGWLGYLGYTASQNGKIAVVSRAQLTEADSLVVADITIDDQGLPNEKAIAVRTISGKELVGELMIRNLTKSIAAGKYQTPIAGQYLLPLKQSDTLNIAGLPLSVGVNVKQPDRPIIYPWNDDVRKQLRSLGFKVD